MGRSNRSDTILRKKRLRRVRRQRKRETDAINASMVTPPEPTVHPAWRRHWMTGSKWKSGQTRAPYGTFKDYDRTLKEVDGKTSWVKQGPVRPMPIHGPVNWDQVWYDWKNVGKDYAQPLAPNSPLSADQLKQMHWYANKHGKIRDIEFVRPIGKGNNASVWMVSAVSLGKITLACKLIKPPGLKKQAKKRMLAKAHVAMNEYATLCRLEHANIVKYYDVITISDRNTRYPFSAILVFTELCHGDLLNIFNILGKLSWKTE